MTDPTPPPEKPTERPAEDVGATEEAAPPPPPEFEDETNDAPPPAAPQKSRTGLIVKLVAGFVVLALIATVVAVVFVTRGEPKHTIALAATAGGMKRDPAKETEFKTPLDTAEKQFKSQAKNVSYVKSGVYNQADSSRGPEGSLVFLGAKLTKEQSPAAFVTAFRKQGKDNDLKVADVSAGPGGGKAVCAYQPTGQKGAICAWATTDSIGELVPTVPGYDYKQLSKIMLALRADVEKTE